MGWFGGSSTPTPAQAAGQLRQENEKDKTLTVAVSQQPATPSNLGADVKPSGEKVKPCCVCKDEKASRDECMLFSRADDPQEDCKGMVAKYKDCMAGYGFKI